MENKSHVPNHQPALVFPKSPKVVENLKNLKQWSREPHTRHVSTSADMVWLLALLALWDLGFKQMPSQRR
jgi:hypothetical protein